MTVSIKYESGESKRNECVFKVSFNFAVPDITHSYQSAYIYIDGSVLAAVGLKLVNDCGIVLTVLPW